MLSARLRAVFALKAMIIELTTIVERPKAIELTVASDKIDLEIEGAKVTGDVVFRGETERINDKAHVRGTVNAEVNVECTRCLDAVTQKFEIVFDDVFVDPEAESTDAEIALEGDDLDEAIAIDGRIDLGEVVREQIILALPDQVFCREDCKGLCPKCGSNRNLIDCKCIEAEIDPRWLALKDAVNRESNR